MIWDHKDVLKTSTCWLWQGPKNQKGYGMTTRFEGTQYVHRIAYLQKTGISPKGWLVCHHCDVPNCLNPDHLWLGDNFSNQQDAALKKRLRSQKKTHCKNGHPLSGKNLYICTRGYRECKRCRRDNVRRYRG